MFNKRCEVVVIRIINHMLLPLHVRYDSSGELSQAFFTPQETTTYILWFEADNEGELSFGTSANVSNVTRYWHCAALTVAVVGLSWEGLHHALYGRLSNEACHRQASVDGYYTCSASNLKCASDYTCLPIHVHIFVIRLTCFLRYTFMQVNYNILQQMPAVMRILSTMNWQESSAEPAVFVHSIIVMQ